MYGYRFEAIAYGSQGVNMFLFEMNKTSYLNNNE